MRAYDPDQRSRAAAVQAFAMDGCMVGMDMLARARLLPGTMVAAAIDFGPVIRGQLGMITACSRESWLRWRRTIYFCTFLGDIGVCASGRQLVAFDHGCSLRMLQDPLWFLRARGPRWATRRFAATMARSARPDSAA